QAGAISRPDAPRDSRARQSPVGRGANAVSPRPRPPRTKAGTDGGAPAGAGRVLRHAARLHEDVRSGPAKPDVDGLPGGRKPEGGEGAMKKAAAHWSDLGALTTAGTVAATIFCFPPLPTAAPRARPPPLAPPPI